MLACAPPTPPILSGSLGFYVRLLTEGRPLDHVPDTDARDAARVLPAYEAATMPVSEDLVRFWLLELGDQMAAASAPNEEQVKDRLRGVMLASGDLPASAFSRDTLRDAIRTFTFWPTPAEIDMLVRPAVADLLRICSGLRAVVAKAAPPRAKDPERATGADLTAEARDRILAAFRPQIAAPFAEATHDRDMQIDATRRPKPAYLTGEALAQARRAAGIPHFPRPAAPQGWTTMRLAAVLAPRSWPCSGSTREIRRVAGAHHARVGRVPSEFAAAHVASRIWLGNSAFPRERTNRNAVHECGSAAVTEARARTAQRITQIYQKVIQAIDHESPAAAERLPWRLRQIRIRLRYNGETDDGHKLCCSRFGRQPSLL